MFESLMKFGGYRVDYLQPDHAGATGALGLYILGDLPAGQPYSRTAKHCLFTALSVLQTQQEIQNLVAVYLDINTANETNRPAFQQMKWDMKAGMFRRLCVSSVCDLTGGEEVYEDFWKFYRELQWCEIYSTASGRLAPIAFSELPECPMVSGF
jgi:hypothetical protein